MILADAHVHIYDCFDLEKFLDAAYSNFQTQANRLGHGDKFTPILLLAEDEKNSWFNRFRKFADGRNVHTYRAKQKWKFFPTDERISIVTKAENSKALIIIAGRQVKTVENLEVLALCTTNCFKSGTPIVNLINEVKKNDAIPVIPWGFGKWLGRRGLILKKLLETAKSSDFFLGENGGRLKLSPRPFHFKIAERRSVRILPGTDPLPIKSELLRVGSFGFCLYESCSHNNPAKDFKKILQDHSTEFVPYGQLKNFSSFLKHQFSLWKKI